MENSFIDLIIRLKNGYLVGKEIVHSPHSHFKEEILAVLKTLAFIKNYKVEGDKKKSLIIDLKYVDGQPAITNIKIISKLGQRTYVSYKDLKPVLSGLGYSILSTPKGVMTNRQARKEKVGGELLFQIW